MGFGGISPGSLILIFLIVALIFGTKRLKTVGQDLGQALRGFKRGLSGEEPLPEEKTKHPPAQD